MAERKSSEEIKAIISQIITDISESASISTRTLCKKYEISQSTLMKYLDEDASLAEQYARAKQRQAELMADEILAIADDASEDELFVEAEDGSGKSARRVINHEAINRSRLKVDTRKWLMSKLLPKKYGDKLELQHEAGASIMAAVAAKLSGSEKPESGGK